MARLFGGGAEYLESGAGEPTGLNTATQTVLMWVYNTSTASSGIGSNERVLFSFSSNNTFQRGVNLAPPTTSGYKVRYALQASTPYTFQSDDVTASVWHSVVVAHDRATTATVNPSMWVDGASVSVTKAAGSGTPPTVDNYFRVGHSQASQSTTLSATLGPVGIVNSILDAAAANRFHWWGMAPGGPSTMLVCLPLWTDDVANKGTGGTFTMSVTSTSMNAMPKVERCWASTMGCGR